MYSIYIPMHSNPSYEEIKNKIEESFKELMLSTPKILKNDSGDIEIFGKKEDEVCVFSSTFLEPLLREVPKCNWMGDVRTRGSWLFAGIVVYAVAKNFGEIILNDSGARIGVPGSYSVHDFHAVIKNELAKARTRNT